MAAVLGRGAWVFVLLLSLGCDGNEAAAPIRRGTPENRAVTTTTTSPYPAAVDPNRGFSSEEVRVESAYVESKASVLFRQIRIADAEGFERVVFEFEEALPRTFFVKYDPTPDIIGEGGCEAPERRPGANLVVSFYPSGTREDAASLSSRRSYTGAERIRPRSTEEILEAVLFCEFEVTLEWVVIVRNKQPFRVTTLADPPRLVVDVQARAGEGQALPPNPLPAL